MVFGDGKSKRESCLISDISGERLSAKKEKMPGKHHHHHDLVWSREKNIGIFSRKKNVLKTCN